MKENRNSKGNHTLPKTTCLSSFLRLALILVMLVTSVEAATAQDNTLKFMGIPVKGTVAQMTQKLKAKGFRPAGKSGVLTGTFKGKKVELIIVPQNGKVVGISTRTKETMDNGQAFIYYTNLCKQYLDSYSYEHLMSNTDENSGTFMSSFIQKSKNPNYNLDFYDQVNRMVVILLQKATVYTFYGKVKDIGQSK